MPPWRRFRSAVVGRPGLSLAVFFATLTLSGSTDAYRFWTDKRTDELLVGAEYALRWSPEVWAPGETLVWEVAPDPDFDLYFGSPEGVLPYVERDLAAWSGIPTADIKWRVDGVREEAFEEDSQYCDGRNTVFVDAGADCGAYMSGCDKFISGRSRFVEVDVALCMGFTEIPEDVAPEDLDSIQEDAREWSVFAFSHEFGHALGLGHSGAVSLSGRDVAHGAWRRWVQRPDPVMSYGNSDSRPGEVTADDAIGVSLLRPVRGRHRTTGSISGSLQLAGEPAPYVQVWTLPMGDQPLSNRVGAFSNADGVFLIEGLEPG